MRDWKNMNRWIFALLFLALQHVFLILFYFEKMEQNPCKKMKPLFNDTF